MRYKDYNDYELLSVMSEADENANEILFEKYRPLIVSIATKMINYCKGTSLEINDLIQEGMLGLNIAINRFNNNKETSFYTYAKKCIESKMISLVIASRRLKHKFLNDSISIEYLLNKYEIPTYYGIIGFVIASIISIFITAVSSPVSIMEIFVGILLMVVGMFIAKFIGDK